MPELRFDHPHFGTGGEMRRVPETLEMIPRRIIQTGPPKLSLLLQSAIQNVKLLHPTFEYAFFDDARVDSFIEEYFPEHRRVYESFRFRIQKYDFFRYLAVYQLGGFYLDLDIFLAKDLTPLLNSRCVFPFEELTHGKHLWEKFGMDWHLGNYAFGAVPKHPFLAAVIENCLRAKNDPAWVAPMLRGIPKLFHDQFYILNTTGPGLISRTYAENPDLANDLNVLFPEDVREREGWHKFGDFGVHHMAGSWRARQSFLVFRLFRIWDSWTLKRVLDNASKRGKTRTMHGRPMNAR